MLGFSIGSNKATDALRKALYESHAIIEFDLDQKRVTGGASFVVHARR